MKAILLIGALFLVQFGIAQNTWSVKYLTTEQGDTLSTKFPDLKINTNFINWGIKLSVNVCNGWIHRYPNDSLKADGSTCTEACCDSRQERSIITLMNNVKRIEFKGPGQALIHGDTGGEFKFPSYPDPAPVGVNADQEFMIINHFTLHLVKVD